MVNKIRSQHEAATTASGRCSLAIYDASAFKRCAKYLKYPIFYFHPEHPYQIGAIHAMRVTSEVVNIDPRTRAVNAAAGILNFRHNVDQTGYSATRYDVWERF